MSAHASPETSTGCERRSPGQRWRLRGDVQVIERQAARGREFWLVNPIQGRAARIAEEDYQRLKRFEQDSRGATSGPGGEDLGTLAGELAASGFVAGATIASRSTGRPWWRNPLFIRLPGVGADPLARWLADHSGWVFSPAAALCWGLWIVATAWVLVSRFGELWFAVGRLPAFQAQHWAAGLLALVLTRVVHELAHAAVCRRMGARCREIGVLLMCGAPCLYCDVSDSWRVPSRRGRIAIMLAGVYAEAILASLAAWYWITSPPSVGRMMALHVMVICGVSTLVVNLNPLMRFDGYFVLADVLNLANLRQRAHEAWRATVVRWLGGARYMVPWIAETGARRWGLCGYHAASWVYRWTVTAALCGWFYLVAVGAGLEPLGRTLVMLVVFAVTGSYVVAWGSLVGGKGAWRAVHWLRRVVIGGTAAAVVGAVLCLPVERRIHVTGRVDLAASTSVFVPSTGTVAEVAAGFGDRVAAGQVLMRMESVELELEHERNVAASRQARLRYEGLLRQSLHATEEREKLEDYRLAVRAAEDQQAITERQRQQLTVVAACDGWLMRPMPASGAPSAESDIRLDELANRKGATLEAGFLWCRIGDPERKHVLLDVDAAERRYVVVGAPVRIALSHSGSVVECPVTAISAVEHDDTVDDTVQHPDRFVIACALPPEIARTTMVGATASGVFRGNPTRLWDVIVSRVLGRSW